MIDYALADQAKLPAPWTRRQVLAAGLATAGTFALAACTPNPTRGATGAGTPLPSSEAELMPIDFIAALPKAELHVHLEGTIEPADMFRYAERNGLALPWASEEDLRAAYSYTGLDDFLALLWEGCRVLTTREDFYDLTMTYLQRVSAQGVVRAEMSYAPHNFLPRGISIDDQIGGITDAITDARTDLGIDGALLVGVQRHRTEAEGFELLDLIRPHRESLLGISLGGPEVDNPPSKFARLYAAARNEGYRLTAHAGEEAPPSYITQALDECHVDRIDHGYTAFEDPGLVARLADEGVPVTMCPLSNLRLQVTDDLSTYPLTDYLNAGVNVSVNSDDPPYFGGYVNENFEALAEHLDLGRPELTTLARNSFTGSFGSTTQIDAGLAAVDEYERTWSS